RRPGAARRPGRAVPRGRRALPLRARPGLGRRRGRRRLDAGRARGPRRLCALAAVVPRRAPEPPAPRALGGRAGRRHGVPRRVLRRARRAPRPVRGRPPRDRPLGRRRALARRGDRPGQGVLRGADPDQPGRPAEPHLPADPHDDALAAGQGRRDPLGAGQRRRRVGVARRHGRRARRGADLLHALARPVARRRGARHRRGLLRAAHRRARGRGARGARPREDRQKAPRGGGRRGGLRGGTLMATQASPVLDVRADFPILAREIDGKRIVYLDSAASAQKPEAVLDAMDRFYRTSYSNVHRGVYTLAQEATELFEGARARIAAFVGGEAQTTIFTRNGTEALNLVARAWGKDNVGRGDAVLVTEME